MSEDVGQSAVVDEVNEDEGWDEFTKRFFADSKSRSSPDATLMKKFALLASSSGEDLRQ